MKTISAAELRDSDPKRFQKEYNDWVCYAFDHDWWDYIEDNLKRELDKVGVTVDHMYFSLGYSQSDYATFTGTVHVSEWMGHNKDGDQTYADKYPALYLDMLNDGTSASIRQSYRGGWGQVNMDVQFGNTYPSGIFQHLDPESWDELVEEQYDDANLHDAMQEWVKDRSKQLYRQLQDEYEAMSSEDSFVESCEINEVTFEINEECEA